MIEGLARGRALGLITVLLASVAALGLGTVLGLGAVPAPAGAQATGETTQVVIFIIDLSGSMNEPFDDERTKLDVAKEAFAEAFAEIRTDAVIGLRVYGNQLASTSPANREQNCTVDTEVLQQARPVGETDLVSIIGELEATGDTSIALALESADLEDIPDGAFGTIVLFSDGRDECFDADLDGDPTIGPSWGKDPCEVARAIAGEGVDLKIDRIETVGFRAGPEAEQELRCIADVSGGSFTRIETPEDAREILPELLSGIASLTPAPEVDGVEISGTPDQTGAPALPSLADPAAGEGHFEDEISINTEKWYRVAEYGPGQGTFTATVFGLPAQEGISFSQRLYLPETDQTFFTEENAAAGLPRRATASLRCPGCSVSGGPNEVYWIVSLRSENPDLEGTFRLELQTEGPAYGGSPINCQEPQACWYEGQISARTAERDGLRDQYDNVLAESGADVLVEQRRALEADVVDLESRAAESTAKQDELTAQVESLGGPSTSLGLPLALAGAGVVAGAAGGAVATRRRSRGAGDSGGTGSDAASPADDSAVIGHIITDDGPDDAPADPGRGGAEATTVAQDPVEGPEATDRWLGTSVYREDLPPPELSDQTTEAASATRPTQPAEPAPPTQPAEAAEPAKPAPTPAGWYPDPEDPARFRWWDGSNWTTETAEGEGGQP